MTAYLVNHQKKKRILAQKEQELMHAIEHNHSYEKLVRAAENVKAARLRVFKSEFARLTDLPLNSYVLTEDAQRWEALPIDEIIETYRKQLAELLAAAENKEQEDDS